MSDEKSSCAEPAAGPIVSEEQETETHEQPRKGTTMVQAKVGHKAPDFEATAFMEGGFTNVKLSDYAGRWVALCFYPGDFTFV